MDKSTLSGYGWVIIVTLVLAVMLAFATPFGKYVGQGVSSVAKGLVSSGDEALSEDNRTALENEWNEFLNETTTGDCKIGDVNKDKNINEDDYKALNKVLNGYPTTNFDPPAADLDGDGDVDQTDMTVLGAFVGMPYVTPPSGTENFAGTIIARGPKNLVLNSCTVGDINNDGKINVRDLGLLQQVLHGWDVEASFSACDINGDGKISIEDLILLQNYINGYTGAEYNRIGTTQPGNTKTIISNQCLVGDVNEDGKVNTRDLGLLQQYQAGWEVPVDEPACDVNWDGTIDADDITELQNYINGHSTKYANTIQIRVKKSKSFNTCVIGDLDQNGAYNMKDLGLLQQTINGWDLTKLSEVRNLDLSAADINWDGKIDSSDLTALQEYISGWSTGLVGTSKPRTTKTVVQVGALIGDVNNDLTVNDDDLNALCLILNGYNVKYNKLAADITGDGKVNMKDAGALQQWLEGMNNTQNADVGKIRTK